MIRSYDLYTYRVDASKAPIDRYVPHPSIDHRPFSSLRRVDLHISGVPTDAPPDILEACFRAVQDVSAARHDLGEEQQRHFTTVQTAVEVQTHTQIFASQASNVIGRLIQAHGRVSVSGVPTGGIAPLHAVMEKVAGLHPDLLPYISFEMLHKPNEPHDRQSRSEVEGHSAQVVIDDGLSSGVLRKILRVRGVDASSLTIRAMIGKLAEHNIIVLAPFCRESVHDEYSEGLRRVSAGRNDTWAAACRLILDPSVTVRLPTSGTFAGASVGGIPCRDLEMPLEKISYLGGLTPSAVTQLHQAGLNRTKFRLFAVEESLIHVDPIGSRIAAELLVMGLNARMAQA